MIESDGDTGGWTVDHLKGTEADEAQRMRGTGQNVSLNARRRLTILVEFNTFNRAEVHRSAMEPLHPQNHVQCGCLLDDRQHGSTRH